MGFTGNEGKTNAVTDSKVLPGSTGFEKVSRGGGKLSIVRADLSARIHGVALHG
jgi:hypothetical protein